MTRLIFEWRKAAASREMMKSACAFSAQARTMPSSKSGSFDFAADRQTSSSTGTVSNASKAEEMNERAAGSPAYFVKEESRFGPSRSLGHRGVEDNVRIDENPVIHNGSQ